MQKLIAAIYFIAASGLFMTLVLLYCYHCDQHYSMYEIYSNGVFSFVIDYAH